MEALERASAEQAQRVDDLTAELEAERERSRSLRETNDRLDRANEELSLSNRSLAEANDHLEAMRGDLEDASRFFEERAAAASVDLARLQAGADLLAQAAYDLSRGVADDDTLSRAQSLLSGPSLRVVVLAREYLANGDLYNARVAAEQALATAAAARAAATGTAPVVPGY